MKEPATSKRNRARPAGETTTEPTPDAPNLNLTDHLRRILLAILTALVVARPALRGESLGLVSDLSDPAGLIWMSAVVLACGLWAVWRMWSGRDEFYLGRVEIALAVGVAFLFVTAFWSAYRRAALLGGFESIGLVALVLLARQLAISEREKAGLYTVLLATGVALAAQGVYQWGWELPRARAEAAEAKETARLYVAHKYEQILETVSDAEREELAQRLTHGRPSATFLYPSTLAAALGLVLPGLFLAAVLAVRGGAEGWQLTLAWLFALMTLVCLILTGSWAAILATVAGCVAVLMNGRVVGWLVGLIASAAMGSILWAGGALSEEIRLRSEAWPATWKVLHAGHRLTGIGAGHLGFYYPAHMQETDGAVPLSANSGLLELWLLGGPMTLLAVVVALGMLTAITLRWWRAATELERDHAAKPSQDLPWEFYLGGMFGVLLGFILRTSSLAEADIINIAVLAAIGALAWFAAFALFEQVAWSPGQRVAALSAGITAMVLALTVGPGTDRPALLALLALAVGLLLAHVQSTPSRLLSQPGLAQGIPAAALLAAAAGLFLFVVIPAANTASVIRKARIGALLYRSHWAVAPEKRTIRDPLAFLRDNVLEPLRLAIVEEPDVVRTNALLGRWKAEEWALTWLQPDAEQRRALAFAYAGRARTLCSKPENKDTITPVGTEGLFAEYTIFQLFIQRMNAAANQLDKEAKEAKLPAQKTEIQKIAEGRRVQAREAARTVASSALVALRKQDPTNPQLAFLEAQTWDQAGDRARRQEAVTEALHLDERVGEPRRLSNAQKGQLEEWQKAETQK